VVIWGDGSFGQTNVPQGLSGVAAIAAGANHSIALKSNGTVVAWGRGDFGQTNVPTGLTNAVAIASGADFSFALKSDGTLTMWGDDDGGGLSPIPARLSNVVMVAAGDNHALALVPVASGSPPSIVGQPTNKTAYAGLTAVFGVTAFGTAPLNYQWRFNG